MARTTLNLDEDVHEEVEQSRIKDKRSFTGQVNILLREALDARKGKGRK